MPIRKSEKGFSLRPISTSSILKATASSLPAAAFYQSTSKSPHLSSNEMLAPTPTKNHDPDFEIGNPLGAAFGMRSVLVCYGGLAILGLLSFELRSLLVN